VPREFDWRRRLRLTVRQPIVWTLLVIFLAYAGSQMGYYLLGGDRHELSAPDPDTIDDTLVLIRVNGIDTLRNTLDLDILMYPDDEFLHRESGVLVGDLFVRLDSESELQEIRFPQNRVPARISTALRAAGDPDNWPFDRYATEPTSVSVLATGNPTPRHPAAQVEVAGHVDGWYIQRDVDNGVVSITLQRARGSLAFDVGVCLVLVSLPAMALFVAVETFRGREKYDSGHSALLAVMLFAIVPLRSILPGAPPPGAWIDQTIVLWVLIALVTALAIHLAAWRRQTS